MSAEYLALLLADGRLPVGAHTQSAGVEPAMQAGLTLEQVPDYLGVRLRTVTEVEAAAAVVARHVWNTPAALVEARTSGPSTSSGHVERSVHAEPVGSGVHAEPVGSGVHAEPVGSGVHAGPVGRGVQAEPVEALVAVDRGWRARTASDALRDASDLLGRGYLRLASRLWDLDALAGRTWCRPVVLGVMAAEAGLDPAQTARLVGFEDVQAAIAAALKLSPFDPGLGVVWARAAGVQVEAMVARVAGSTCVDDIPAYAAVQIEHWAQRHRLSERRLFRA